MCLPTSIILFADVQFLVSNIQQATNLFFLNTKCSNNSASTRSNGYLPYIGTFRMNLDKFLPNMKRDHTPYFNFDIEVKITPNLFMSFPYVNLYHRASYYFLSIFWFWKIKYFFLSYPFFDFTITRFSSFIYTLLIWITSTKCSIPLQEFIKDWVFVAHC